VIGFLGRPHRRATGLCLLVFLAAFAVAIGGCGSDEEPAKPGGSSGDEVATGGGDEDTSPAAGGGTGEVERSTSAKAGDEKEQHGNRSSKERRPRGPAPDAGSRSSSRGREAARVAEACPDNLSRAECAATARSLARDDPSRPIDEASDCLEIMSRAQCEELARAANEARRTAAGSVDPEECVRNPTPHCEKVLGPVLEAQHAASQEADE
jgi:hypothetical protein